MTEMKFTCRSCGQEYFPASWNLATWDHECVPCRRHRQKAWRAQRKAEGRPVAHTRMPPEWQKEYEAKRRSDPAVKKLRCLNQKRYREDPDLRPRHVARWIARRAIAAGKLVRQPCEVCGAIKVDAHHDDYDRPLDVRWLCPPHHREHHARATGEAG